MYIPHKLALGQKKSTEPQEKYSNSESEMLSKEKDRIKRITLKSNSLGLKTSMPTTTSLDSK